MRRAVLVAAVVAALCGCSAGPPPLARSVPPATAPGAGQVQPVYVAPVSPDCPYAALSGFAPLDAGIVLAENTCVSEAGDEDPDAAQFRLVLLRADGTEQLQLPEGVGGQESIAVLGADADGGVYLRARQGSSTRLLRRSADGAWADVSEPAQPGEHHSGDGGPAVEAVVEEPLDVDVGPTGERYVLEPHAVRRIDAGGTITTVAGSARDDPADLSDFVAWGGAGVGSVAPDPRPLPAGPVVASEFPLPRLTAMEVGADGTVWLASHDAVLRLGTDGMLVVQVDAATAQPSGQQSALVGGRGLASSITDLVQTPDGLLLVDSWSARVLRLDGRRLDLVLGRPEEQRASCPQAVLGEPLPATRVCAGALAGLGSGRLLVTHVDALLVASADVGG